MSGAGECPHLDPAYRKFAALPDEERIAWIRADRWIGFDQAGLALARLENLLTYPPRDRMPCLLIYGDTGMGKTKIVRKFERAHPPKFCQVTGVDHRPIVVAQVPSEPIERDSTANCCPVWARRQCPGAHWPARKMSAARCCARSGRR